MVCLFICLLPLASYPSAGGRQPSPLQSLRIFLEEAICSPRVPQWDWTTQAGQSPRLTLVSSVPFSCHISGCAVKDRGESGESYACLSGRSSPKVRDFDSGLIPSTIKDHLVPKEGAGADGREMQPLGSIPPPRASAKQSFLVTVFVEAGA